MKEESILAVQWREDQCILLDQTELPQQEKYIAVSNHVEMVQHIRRLVVRGAPAIGIAAAYGVVLAIQESLALEVAERKDFIVNAMLSLSKARPTAVNLTWAIERMKRHWEILQFKAERQQVEELLQEAIKIHQEDIENNRRMAQLGAEIIPNGPVITHCNAGALATGGVGTAVGIVAEAFRQKKITHVYVSETRPLLQGARLTAWELDRLGIPFTIICDNAAAAVIRSERVVAGVVGADRIVANGDVANKIGTYSLAVACHYHRVPLLVAAPISTFDMTIEEGDQIPIEFRSTDEILGGIGGRNTKFNALNPAFDVTPHELVSTIVCERGIIEKPNRSSVSGFLNSIS